MFMGIVAFIILIPIVVFVHEFGHFLFARINGVKVESFSIGFGMKLFGWRDSFGTEWKVCLVPLGGYVKMLGQSDTPETSEQKQANRKKLSKKEKSESFEFKKRYQKASIVFAGPLFNFILGILVFFCLFFFIGMAKYSPVIHSVVKESPAVKAGLKSGDKLISLGSNKIEIASDVSKIMKEATGKPMPIVVERDGKVLKFSITPKKSDGKFLLGIVYAPKFENYTKVGFIDAVKNSYNQTSTIVVETVKSLGEMIIGKRSSKDLGGMISIAQISGSAFENGFYSFMYLMAFISISLGLFNLFPIPVLDGGYLFIYIIEGIIRRDLPEKLKEIMFLIGFWFIIFLLLLSNYNDIIRLLK